MDIISFLKNNVTAYHLVDTMKRLLAEQGFRMLSMGEPWELAPGAYMTSPADSQLFAWVIGEDYNAGDAMCLALAHTDYPCLHIKPSAEVPGGYCVLDTETYGGPILSTWLDRPLGIAGRVYYADGDKTAMRLVDSVVPVLTIPNLPIHFNREVNKGVELKKQIDMRPLGGMKPEKGWFQSFVADLCGCDAADILDFDLWVYNNDEPETVGFAQDMISSPRLDNQTSCYAILEGLFAANAKKSGLKLGAFFDNEEIGSQTKQGADSAMLSMLLGKIYDGLGYANARLTEAIVKSTMLSVDVAHALHPNHPERYDAQNAVSFGEGVVLKLSANQRYTYESETIARLALLCRRNGIPFGKHVNHSDIPGGSTMGPLVSSWLPMAVADVGVPIMAMHSARELMAKQDMEALIAFVEAFFTN